MDAAGNLLIADTLNNRVEVLAERSGTFDGIRMTAGQVNVVVPALNKGGNAQVG